MALDHPRSIASGDNASAFNHENDRANRRAGAVHNPFRNDDSLPRRQRDGALFELNYEFAIDHVEKLILSVVFVPVIFPLHDAQPDDRIVYLT
jgi:hypothetical protein